jgi:AcrR family transcriptional regulator
MARIRKKPDLRRQEILDASLKLFVEKGFQSVAIGDIAETVGVARTTLYEYYTSKEQILIELVDQVADEVREIVPQGKNCKDKLEDMAGNILKQIYENQQVYYLIFKEAPVLSATVSEKLVKWRLASFAQIQNIIAEGEQELTSTISKDDAAFAFLALTGQRAGDILLTREAIDINIEARRLVNILWSGLAKRQ